ncbi:LOW QUALITY PROTEIN: importin-4 [Emydura macquarii macquarii]|uniref:LOW QUALITY PROTEIN: importin-4 n=1 Tax=Emydura macquarii macquarii TaxID=1129001 RepID=UPI00352A8D09
MEPRALGHLLGELLQPDTGRLQRATAQLREAFRHPEVLPQLCQLLSGAQDPQIRQLAAVLLRQRLTKHWRKLSPEERDRLKSLVLGALQQEAEHQVSVALAQLAALLLRQEGPGGWPQLLQLIQQGTHGPDPHRRQVSLLVLSSALDSDPEGLAPHYPALLRLLHGTLGQHGQPGALYYGLRGLAAMAPGLGPRHLNLLRSLVPKVISAVRQLIPVNEVHATEAMEVFDELLESEASVVVQHLADVVAFCLEVASNRALGDALRAKALCTLSFLIKLRGKAVVKQRLLPPLLDTLFPILGAEPPPGQLDAEDEEDADELGGAEVQNPKHVAAQVIDMLALHLPPEKLFPQLMPRLEPALQSPRPYERKAGLLCLAVLAEGCGDHIRTRHLQSLLGVICQALADESLVVRGAALFALGQFSENLQPDIGAFAGEVLPLLLSYLGGLDPAQGGHLAKAYYALENFVENLGPRVEPFLPALMELTLGALRAPGGPRPKELAISALGAVASAAQGAMGPYLPHVLEQLRRFLPPAAPQEQHPLQCQAVETLGALARALGAPFGALAEESCHLGLSLAEGQDDPDLRRCTFSLFGALACAVGDELAPHLPRIVTLLLYSLRSTEGLVPPDGGGSSFLLFEDEEEEAEVEGDEDLAGEEDEEEEEELFGLSVESAYMAEKEDAVAALGEIAANASVAFLPYVESCVPEVHKLLEFPHVGVRKAAYEALGQLCIGLHRACEQEPSQPHGAALQRLLGGALPALARGARRERERLVALAALEALGAVLGRCRQEALREPGRLGELCSALRAVLEHKTACQDDGLDEDEDDEEQAELDAMVLEYAGEGIPPLAAAAGGDAFAPYFAGFLPLLLNKLKPSCSVAERSFAVGTLAETLGGLGRATAPFVPRLLPPFLAAARDPDPEVRSNGVFALGALAEHGGEALLPHYPAVLAQLAGGSAQEPSARVRDNVCGAVARMILSQPQALPLGQVFPALLRALPLTEDLEENKTVFRCIQFLYETQPQQVLEQVGEVVRASSTVLGTDHLPADAQVSLVSLLRHLSARCPTEFQAALLSLPPDAGTQISGALCSP